MQSVCPLLCWSRILCFRNPDFTQSLPSFVLIYSYGCPQTHCNVFTPALPMMTLTLCWLISSCSPSYCSHHISVYFFSQPYQGSHMISKIYWYNFSPKSKLLFRLLLILQLDFCCFSIINCTKGRVKSCTVFNHKCESVASAKPLTSHLIEQLLWAVQGAALPPAAVWQSFWQKGRRNSWEGSSMKYLHLV